jgi:hypothetical protein
MAVPRRSPCETYIKYLLLHPEKFTTDVIMEQLQLLHLDFLQPEYIERLRRSLRPPKDFRTDDQLHRVSVNYMHKQGVYRLFFEDNQTTDALDILHSPRGKEAMEESLLYEFTDHIICLRMAKLSLRADSTTIQRYSQFFFDLTKVDTTEARALMNYRTTYKSERSSHYGDQLEESMRRAGYKDSRRLATDCIMLSTKQSLGRAMVGIAPNRLNRRRLQESIADVALSRAMETLSGPMTHETVLVPPQLTQMAHRIIEHLEETGKATEESVAKQYKTWAMKLAGPDVPIIGELSDGNHTTDLMPAEGEEVK